MKQGRALLTCPFCGSDDVVDVIHWVECKTCEAKGPKSVGYDWNDRAFETKDSGKTTYVHQPIDQPKCGVKGW